MFSYKCWVDRPSSPIVKLYISKITGEYLLDCAFIPQCFAWLMLVQRSRGYNVDEYSSARVAFSEVHIRQMCRVQEFTFFMIFLSIISNVIHIFSTMLLCSGIQYLISLCRYANIRRLSFKMNMNKNSAKYLQNVSFFYL